MADLSSAMTSVIANPVGSRQVYTLDNLFLAWEEIGKMMVRLTDSTFPVQPTLSNEWQRSTFLNEVWDLSGNKAERELGHKLGGSTERILSSFMGALRNCVAQVKKKAL